MEKQKTYKQLIEWLADLEHQQWSHWTKYFLDNIVDKKDGLIRLDLVQRWKRQTETSYKQLSEREKNSDREWAEKIITEMPFKCPLHQCGGIMQSSIRKKPKDIDADVEGYDGDEQTPDLICTNCKAIYQFTKFNGGKAQHFSQA